MMFDHIPNNVDLAHDRRLQRALEKWQPAFLDWWQTMGPEGFQLDKIYLRTAVAVDPKGWAHFEHVKMPDYRWGIFLTPHDEQRMIGFGDNLGLAGDGGCRVGHLDRAVVVDRRAANDGVDAVAVVECRL